MPAEFIAEYKGKYKQGMLPAPSDVAPDSQTELEKWALQWSMNSYGQHCCGLISGGEPGTIRGGLIGRARAYGRGEQETDQYRKLLDIEIKDKEGKKSQLMNISYKNVRIYPAFRERIIDRLMEVKFTPGVVAVDTPAQLQKQLNYFRDRLAADPNTQAVFQQTGLTPDNVSPAASVMDQSDIDTLNALGGYRLAAEIELQAAIIASMDLSRFDPVIKRQIIEDLVDLNFMTLHVKHDPATMQQVIEYVDPDMFIGRTGDNDDCRSMDMGGFLSYKTISQLRHDTGFDEAALWEIAKNYRNRCGNETYSADIFNEPPSGSRSAFSQRLGSGYRYDQFRVQVFTHYLIGADVERYVYGCHGNGSMIFDKVARDATLNKRNIEKGKTMQDSVTQYVYRACWIVGSNYVYNVGKDDVTVRDGSPGDMKALIPIIVWKGNRPSITQSVESVIDDLQMAVLRGRNVLAKMPPPPNIAINVAALEEFIQLGTMNVSTTDLLDILSIKGVLLYSQTQEFGQGSVASPISALPDTTLSYMQTIQKQIDDAINQLRLVSGSNELSDGTANPTDVLNGVAQGYENASNRALSFMYTAHEAMHKNLCLQLVRRYQMVAAKGGSDLKYIPTGSTIVRTIELLPEYSVHDMWVTVSPDLDKASRQAILQSLMQNKQNAMINESDYLTIYTMLNRGQVQEAEFYLAKAVERKRMQDEQSRNQAMQVQAQAQSQTAQATEQAKANGQMMILEGQSKLLTLEYKLKDENAQNEFERQSKLLTLQAAHGVIEKSMVQTEN